jgi:hypothetical protein
VCVCERACQLARPTETNIRISSCFGLVSALTVFEK